mmetsp:Transcript_2596/g.5656  ORF Transcript_2596/g.5656 Transcript_2596/m.5656 type:complete len:224 (-) Transcript_2596:866-1537(-)
MCRCLCAGCRPGGGLLVLGRRRLHIDRLVLGKQAPRCWAQGKGWATGPMRRHFAPVIGHCGPGLWWHRRRWRLNSGRDAAPLQQGRDLVCQLFKRVRHDVQIQALLLLGLRRAIRLNIHIHGRRGIEPQSPGECCEDSYTTPSLLDLLPPSLAPVTTSLLPFLLCGLRRLQLGCGLIRSLLSGAHGFPCRREARRRLLALRLGGLHFGCGLLHLLLELVRTLI